MTIWHVITITLYVSSLLWGRRALWFWLVMLGNFAATVALDGGLVYVSIVDVLCASLLIGRGSAANMVALVFTLMVPVYLVAWALHWNNYTTYAIIDVLAYIQCAIIGGIGGGFVNRYSGFIDRFGFNLGVIQTRVYAESYFKKAFGKAS